MLQQLLKWLREHERNKRASTTENGGEQFTRPATWEDVGRVTSLLCQHGVDFILVGGYALAANGIVRTTEDIDIAVNPDKDNSKKWILALSHLPDGVTRELMDEEDPFDGDYTHALRVNDAFTVDIMPSVCGISFDELRRYAVDTDIGGTTVPVLSLDGLLLTKSGVREKDRLDAEAIRRAIEFLGQQAPRPRGPAP